MGKAVKPRYLLFPVTAETSTVNGYPGQQTDWTKFCWDGSEKNKFEGKMLKAPLPLVDGFLIGDGCEYLHVPYNFAEDGTISRVRPRKSLRARRMYHGRLILQQRAVKRDEGWYWEIELGEVRP